MVDTATFEHCFEIAADALCLMQGRAVDDHMGGHRRSLGIDRPHVYVMDVLHIGMFDHECSEVVGRTMPGCGLQQNRGGLDQEAPTLVQDQDRQE